MCRAIAHAVPRAIARALYLVPRPARPRSPLLPLPAIETVGVVVREYERPVRRAA